MSAPNPQGIILKPVVTEKTLRLANRHRAYTFRVAPRANKVQVRDAIERLFDVTVTDVRTANHFGKYRRMGRSFGRTSAWKKAIVTVQEGDSIDIYY